MMAGLVVTIFAAVVAGQEAKQMRLGMIGLDIIARAAFAKLINDPEAKGLAAQDASCCGLSWR